MVLGQFSDICANIRNWPRTIRATVPQLDVSNDKKKSKYDYFIFASKSSKNQ
jgi:hypothetical protein